MTRPGWLPTRRGGYEASLSILVPPPDRPNRVSRAFGLGVELVNKLTWLTVGVLMNRRIRDVISIGVLPVFFLAAAFSDYLPFKGEILSIGVFVVVCVPLAVACYYELREK